VHVRVADLYENITPHFTRLSAQMALCIAPLYAQMGLRVTQLHEGLWPCCPVSSSIVRVFPVPMIYFLYS
ncbi:hypothetical protein HAX54_030346, partial [Datura stramonium]|nr:hypothetical protein [Datura stramonium]